MLGVTVQIWLLGSPGAWDLCTTELEVMCFPLQLHKIYCLMLQRIYPVAVDITDRQ